MKIEKFKKIILLYYIKVLTLEVENMKKIIVSLILVFVLTLTLVAAYDYDFCNYPESFVTDGEYNEDNLFVVGDSAPASDTLAIGDVITNLQYLDISWVDSDSITVEGGVTEQVLIGGILTNVGTMNDDQLDNNIDNGLKSGIKNLLYSAGTYATKEIIKQMRTRE